VNEVQPGQKQEGKFVLGSNKIHYITTTKKIANTATADIFCVIPLGLGRVGKNYPITRVKVYR
jgi:hypothetical protein